MIKSVLKSRKEQFLLKFSLQNPKKAHFTFKLHQTIFDKVTLYWNSVNLSNMINRHFSMKSRLTDVKLVRYTAFFIILCKMPWKRKIICTKMIMKNEKKKKKKHYKQHFPMCLEYIYIFLCVFFHCLLHPNKDLIWYKFLFTIFIFLF